MPHVGDQVVETALQRADEPQQIDPGREHEEPDEHRRPLADGRQGRETVSMG